MNKLNRLFDVNERMKAISRQLDFLNCQLCAVKKTGSEKCKAYYCLSLIKEKTKREYNQLCVERLRLYELISNVKDSNLRTLLEYRYVYLMEYEDIAELTNYSLRQIMRKMQEAVKEIEKVSA